MTNLAYNKKSFLEILEQIQVDNLHMLINYLEKETDFFNAPASTRFHGNYEGGLVEHSLHVYSNMLRKNNEKPWADFNYTFTTIVITSLLHDVCKSNFYEVDYKNVKQYSDNGKFTDTKGKYDWCVSPYYTINDKFPYGHGEKSVEIITRFITLLECEKMAIRWHMGFSEPKENWGTLGKAIEKYPLILMLHEADMEATYIDEVER